MKVKKISVFICLTLFGIAVNGQVRQPHALYFMETLPQISQMNPAFQPSADWYLTFPFVNFNVDLFSDIAVKDVLQQHGNKWYWPIEEKYDYAKLWKSIGKNAAIINGGMDWDMIGFGFRMGDGYFSFGVSEHISAFTALPRDLFNVTDKGFPKETLLNFSPMHAKSLAYTQFNIGYSHRIDDKLTVGVNVKPLFGQLAFATKINKFDLYTEEQQWDLNVKGSVYSSLPIDVTKDAEGFIDDVEIKDFDDDEVSDWVNNYVFKNPGIAFDFGAAYKIDERLTVSASLNNLGFISWNNEMNGVSFNGQYKFKGVEYDASSDDEIEDLFSRLWDSIQHVVDCRVQHNKFKTPMTPVFHVGASYRLTNSISVNFLSRSTFWRKSVRQSFNASCNLQPFGFLTFNAGATWQVKGNVFLGGGLTFFAGPVQFYFLTDFIPIRYSTIDGIEYTSGDTIYPIPVPERQKSLTMRTGLNLVFGKMNKPMLEKNNSWK